MFSLASCGAREHIHDPTHPLRAPAGAYVVPPGVLIPHGASLASFKSSGLYAEQGTRSEYCCFIAPTATMRVRKPSGAHELQALIYVPRWAFFEKKPQSVTALVAQGNGALSSLGVLGGLKPGLHRLRWALPVSSATGEFDLVVRLHAGVPVVPEHAGIGVDKRMLGFVLIAIQCT